MELTGYTATGVGTNDVLNVGGNFHYAGKLVVTNTTGFAFAVGQNFQLFNFGIGEQGGDFSTTNLPNLAPFGLAWDTSALDTSGLLAVVVPEPSGGPPGGRQRPAVVVGQPPSSRPPRHAIACHPTKWWRVSRGTPSIITKPIFNKKWQFWLFRAHPLYDRVEAVQHGLHRSFQRFGLFFANHNLRQLIRGEKDGRGIDERVFNEHSDCFGRVWLSKTVYCNDDSSVDNAEGPAFRVLRSGRAFTLIEMLAVILVLLMLAALSFPLVNYIQRRMAYQTARARVAAMSAALGKLQV